MTVIENLEQNLKEFDLILMLIDGGKLTEELTVDFCKSKVLKNTSKKILILSNKALTEMEMQNSQYRRINLEEQDSIYRMYAMYEFSNRFCVLAGSRQYGNLLNYVKTGIMTMEELFEAFFV